MYTLRYGQIQHFKREGRNNGLRKESASGVLYRALMFRLWRHIAKGGIRQEKPPAGHKPPEGVSATHRLESTPDGALTSREASPSQRSSLQGLLPYGSFNQEALGLHTHY
jgi:hypothetical protein